MATITVRTGTAPRIVTLAAGLSVNMVTELTAVAHGYNGPATDTGWALLSRGLIASVDYFPYSAATLNGLRVLYAVGRWAVDPDTVVAAWPAGTRVCTRGETCTRGTVTTHPARTPGHVRVQWDAGTTDELPAGELRPAPETTDSTGAPVTIGSWVRWGDTEIYGRVCDVDPRVYDGRGSIAVHWSNHRHTAYTAADRVAVIPAPDVDPIDPRTARRAWRIIPRDHRLTCTACHGTTVHGGGMQTTDGAQRLCNRCDNARVAAHWADRPAGLYATRAVNAAGQVVATAVVEHTAQRYPADVPPRVQWGLIVSAIAGTGTDRVRRLIGSRIVAAYRAAYNLPAAPPAEVAAAAATDPRTADEKAAAYLTAYAAQLDRESPDAEPVEMRACAFAFAAEVTAPAA